MEENNLCCWFQSCNDSWVMMGPKVKKMIGFLIKKQLKIHRFILSLFRFGHKLRKLM